MSSENSNLSLYNSKYLKYKNKYLSLKKMFGGNKLKLNFVLPNNIVRFIDVDSKENLVQAIADKLVVNVSEIQVLFDDTVINMDSTAEKHSLDKNSILNVAFKLDSDFQKYKETQDKKKKQQKKAKKKEKKGKVKHQKPNVPEEKKEDTLEGDEGDGQGNYVNN